MSSDDDGSGGGSSSRISCKFNIGLHTLILIKNRFQLHALLKLFVIIRFFIVSECQNVCETIYINLNTNVHNIFESPLFFTYTWLRDITDDNYNIVNKIAIYDAICNEHLLIIWNYQAQIRMHLTYVNYFNFWVFTSTILF